MTTPGAYEVAAADSMGKVALLLDEQGGLYSMSLPAGSPVRIAGQADKSSKIVFSPLGTAGMVFLPGSSQLTIVSDLQSVPQRRGVPSTGAVLDATLSDAGSVAIAMKTSGTVSTRVLPTTGSATSLSPLKAYGGMTFIAGTDDLLLADAAANTLVRIRSASTSPDPLLVPTSGLLKAPVAIAVSRSARWAAVANSTDSSVIRVDLRGNTPPLRSACDCQPTLVTQLASEGAFRFTPLQDGPLWIGDASKTAFPVMFIPALAQAAFK